MADEARKLRVAKPVTESNNANQRAIKALIIGPVEKQEGAEPGQSQALPDDPFGEMVKAGHVIEPPFDMLTLAMLPEHNTELGPCIEAMEVNIEGFGERMVSRVDVDNPETPKKLIKLVHKEKVQLDNFFLYATMYDSFTSFRRKLRADLEATGNAYFEVIRDSKNNIQGFTHLPSYQMRLGRLDDKARLVDMPILEIQEDGSIEIKVIKIWQRFRMYVQSKSVHLRNLTYSSSGHKMRYYKQFGDPQDYNNKDGKPAKGKLKPEDKANEVVHFRLYSTRSPYGLPRFVGNLLSIFGDRASEEINYITFKNNNVPSMVVAVSNGQLTQGTIDRIKEFVESQIQAADNYSKFLILEGETFFEGEEGGQVKIDIKPLVKEQHKDALFQNYSKNNKVNVRRSFRLPPIFTGGTDDYTRATAETSRRIGDEQVFAPERDEFDKWINRVLFPAMGIRYHRFKSNSPNTTDNQELVNILAKAEKTGGMTPRIARQMLEDIMGTELPTFPKGFDPDVPFSLTMAEAVKNKAEAVEPGQQVTALKMIEQLTGSESDAPMFTDDTIDRLMSLKNMLEKKWREEVFAGGTEGEGEE